MSTYDLSHLTQPEHQFVNGPIQDDEALVLYSIIRAKRIKTVLEIGGLNGYSAKNFCQAVGKEGTVYTVDYGSTPKQNENHVVIQKDANNFNSDDLNHQFIELVFFDCHDYNVQMNLYFRLLEQGVINDNTILALHDTNLHYPNTKNESSDCKHIHDAEENLVGYMHQAVERTMVNTFTDLGYHALCLHTTIDKHNEDFPQRHGLSVLAKFKKLPV